MTAETPPTISAALKGIVKGDLSPTHWQEITRDPHDARVETLRRDRLRKARRPPVDDRNQYIAGLATKRRVLDVGIVAHTVDRIGQEDWLHGRIRAVAAYTLGVDILPEPVEAMKKMGFNVQCMDITRETPAEMFDLVVCGEIIEHLADIGSIFRLASRVLADGGRIIITSPNAYQIGRVLRYLRNPSARLESVDHVAFMFPSGVCELAERENLCLESYRGVRSHYTNRSVFGHLWRVMRVLFVKVGLLSQEVECESIIYECIKGIGQGTEVSNQKAGSSGGSGCLGSSSAGKGGRRDW
jgi:2-polyprenyl-3-methyl-5-hydroxy-6-metoxy-1,4-benzoquinol methylase